MKKLHLLIELEYDDSIMHGDSVEDADWFVQEILGGDSLVLHSNEIGDEVGVVRVLAFVLQLRKQEGE